MASKLNPTQVEHSNRAKAPPQLPLIDLSELDGPHHENVVEKMINAVQTCGFFLAVNHGLPLEFLEELRDLVHRFFNQPANEKTVHQSEYGPGPLVMYTPSSDSSAVESLLMRYTNEEEALEHWPDLIREMTLKYQKLSSKVLERVLRLLLGNFGVTLDDSMVDGYLREGLVGMNYSKTWDEEQIKHDSVFKHTDYGILASILQDNIGGLFAKSKEGEWLGMTPIPGALVIMAGDCLQVLSNGKYKACEHYVQTTGKEIRVSFPTFMVPRPTTIIQPLPQVVEQDGGKPRYKAILFAEYEAYKLSEYQEGDNAPKSLEILFT